MMKDKNLLCSLLCAAAGIIFCLLYYGHPVHDYGNYYFGSRFALEGKNIHDIYEPWRFNLLIRSQPGFAHLEFLENYAVVPPFTLYFYIPFTWMDVDTSKLVFNFLSVGVFCIALYGLLKHLNIRSWLVITLPLLLFIPFRNNILFGQSYLLLAGFLMAGFVAQEKKKIWLAALFYSLAIVLKISPAILLLYLAATRQFRLLALTAATSAMLFLSALYFTGWDFMMEYIFNYIPRMSVNEINNPYATTYQSVTVLLRNLFIPDKLLNPASHFDSYNAFALISGICMGVLFFFFAKQLFKSKEPFSAFSFALLGGCLFTAYTSTYSLVFLVPAIIEVIRKNHAMSLLIFLLIFLVCNLPVNAFQSLPLLLRFPRLYLLLFLFFLLAGKQEFTGGKWKWLGASVAFFIAVTFFTTKKSNDRSAYYVQDEISLLSYEFSFAGKELTLQTLEAGGPAIKTIQLADSIFSVQKIPLRENQVYYNGFLTSGNDHKLNPVVINKKEIVYLSDKNRGIGFYALRKIDLQQETLR